MKKSTKLLQDLQNRLSQEKENTNNAFARVFEVEKAQNGDLSAPKTQEGGKNGLSPETQNEDSDTSTGPQVETQPPVGSKAPLTALEKQWLANPDLIIFYKSGEQGIPPRVVARCEAHIASRERDPGKPWAWMY